MEKRLHKRVKRALRFQLIRLLYAALGLVPLGVALAAGAALGRLFFRLMRGEREKSLRSLAVAFPELSSSALLSIARRSFEHLGKLAAELCCLRQIDRQMRDYVELPEGDRTRLDAACAEGRGVLWITGHVGNFELMARRVALDGYPSWAVVKPPGDPRLAAFIERVRASGQLHTIWRGKGTALRQMREVLARHEMVGVLIDQDTRTRGLFVDFFGRKAWTPRAAADLALETFAPVIYAATFRKPGGGHRIELTRLPVRRTGDAEADSLALLQTMSSAIEQSIRSLPEGWVWVHQRWKTRPPPEESERGASWATHA
jgi:KDO2-lipid IV(A) lauroyltransferase